MTTITEVIAGTIVRFYTSTPFTNVNGVVTDPGEVVFAYQVSNGTLYQATYGVPQTWGTIVKDSVGTYHIDIDTTGQPGIWTFVWAGAGVVQARSESQLMVVEPAINVTF